MEQQLVGIALSALCTGVISSAATIIAIKVHINYLKEGQDRHEKAITRSHQRIDDIERRCIVHEARQC